MTFKSPKEELQELLDHYPPWVEKIFWNSPSPTNLRPFKELLEKYESILQRIPDRWREYCQTKKKYASRYAQRVLGPLPGRGGRPRKDELAEEAKDLKSAGKSYAQISKTINLRHGAGTTNPEAIRALLRSRKNPTPDKTS